MTSEHRKPIDLVRRLAPSPHRLAVAAAVQDPGPLLALGAARRRGVRAAG